MKSKNNKLMYVSAAVLAAGAVAGVNTQNAHAAEVQRQAEKNTDSKLNAQVADKIAENKQTKIDLTKSQNDLQAAKSDKVQAETNKSTVENTLSTKKEAVQEAENKLDQAKTDLNSAQTKAKELRGQYDSSYKNNVENAQAEKNAADQEVRDTSNQVQNLQNQQSDLNNKKASAENKIESTQKNLDTINESTENLSNQVKQLQPKYDQAQKEYDVIKNELETKQNSAQKATEQLKQNEQELANSEKSLNDLQNKSNENVQTINETQKQLDENKSNLSNKQDELPVKQAQVTDLNKQLSDVNGKLTNAINKQTIAKAALDRAKDSVANTMILPDSYVKAAKKWDKISSEDYKHFNKDQFTKEMHAASLEGWRINQYKSNTKDKERMVDLNNLTPEEQLEINEFAINLINQARVQLGNKPWTLNRSAMKFAADVANNYRQNNDNKQGHDVKAITKAARENGLRDDNNWYEDLGRENFGMQLAKDETGAGWTPKYSEGYNHSNNDFNHYRDDMDSLKHHIYDDIKGMLFNVQSDEWLHAGSILSFYYTPQENPNQVGQTTMYSAISIDVQTSFNTPNVILVHYIMVPDRMEKTYVEDPNTHEIVYASVPAYIKDPTKFNVNDNIPLTTTDISKLQQDYVQAQNEVNNYSGQKSSLDSQVKTLNDQIKQDQDTISTLTSKINKLSSDLLAAQNSQKDVATQITATTNQINDLKSKQPALIQAKNATTSELATYKQEHANVITNYTNLKSSLEKLNKDIQENKANQESTENTLEKYKSELESINKELNEINTKLANLKTKSSNAEVKQANAKERLAKAQADYENYVNTHKDLIDQISASDKVIAEKQEAVKEAQISYDRATKEYKDAKSQVTKLADKINNLDQSIAKSKATIKTLSNRIDNNKKVQASYIKLQARKDFDVQINKTLDAVDKPESKQAVKSNHNETSLPQTSANDKLSIFAALAGLSLASLGLGSLAGDKKRKRN